MRALRLLLSTYEFIIARMAVNILAGVAGFFAILSGIKIMTSLLGVTDLFIANVMFGYCGLLLWIVLINTARRSTHAYLKSGHVAAVTALLNNTPYTGSGIRYGFKAVLSKFGATSVMMVVDVGITTTAKKLTTWVIEESNFIPQSLRDGKSGIILNWVRKMIIVAVSYISEIVLSVLYSDPEIGLGKALSRGLGQYIVRWKDMLGGIIKSVIGVSILKGLLSVGEWVLLVYLAWTQSVVFAGLWFVSIRLVKVVMLDALLEPLQMLIMLDAFHKREQVELPEILDARLESLGDDLFNLARNKNRDGIEDWATSLTTLATEYMGHDTRTGSLDRLGRVVNNLRNRNNNPNNDETEPTNDLNNS